MDTSGLVKLICAVNAFGARGDNDPTPLGAAARSAALDAAGVLTRRLVSAHLGGNGIGFDLRGLRDLVRTLDALIVRGDGHAVGLARGDIVMLWALRRAVLERMGVHPGGDVTAETIDLLPEGQAARRLVEAMATTGAEPDAVDVPGLPPLPPASPPQQQQHHHQPPQQREDAAAAAPGIAGPSAAGPSAAGPSAAGPSAAGPSAAAPAVAPASPHRPPADPPPPPHGDDDGGPDLPAAADAGIISYGGPPAAAVPAGAAAAPAPARPAGEAEPVDLAAFAVPPQPVHPAAAATAAAAAAAADPLAAPATPGLAAAAGHGADRRDDHTAQAEAEMRAALGPISRALMRMHDAIEGKAASAAAARAAAAAAARAQADGGGHGGPAAVTPQAMAAAAGLSSLRPA